MQNVVSLIGEHDDDGVKEAEQGKWTKIWEKGSEEGLLGEEEPHGEAGENSGD